MNDRPAREEIYRRLDDVATRARDVGMDALVIVDPANVYYLSGFRTTLHTRFTTVVIRTSDPMSAMLIAPSVDRLLALEPHWYPSLLKRTEIYYEGAPPGGRLASEPWTYLDELIHENDVVGVDFAGASYLQVQTLATRYRSITIRDATEIMDAARRVKSDWEIEVLHRANDIAVGALSHVPTLLWEGLTEIELAQHLDAAARREGADGFAYPTLIGFGPKSLAPHAAPTHRQLEPNQIVTIAFGPSVAGYCADVVRTFFFGQPSDRVADAGRAAVTIQAAALDAVRPGARAGETMVAANQAIQALYPDATIAGRAGHSLGLTIHETPSLTPEDDTVLEPNMVLAIEPRGPAAVIEGIGLYRHCDVVRVTEDGYELLTPLERGLIVVPANGGRAS